MHGLTPVEQTSDEPRPIHPTEWRLLAALLGLALMLRLAVAILFPSIHHADELFQYLEQGHRLAFGYGVVPWEYRDGARSWLLPGAIGGVMAAVDLLGGGPKAYLIAIQTVLSILSLSIVAIAWIFARRIAGTTTAWLAAAIAAVWFELLYFAAKPLTEAVAASTLFWAAYLICCADGRRRGIAVAGGVLLGLTFVLRIHLSPALLLLGAIGLYRYPRRQAMLMMAAGASVVVAAGLLDWATWGAPFKSLWHYVVVNLVEGKAAEFGVSPWYFYAVYYYKHWTLLALPVALLSLAGARRAPYLLGIGAVIVLAHSAIGHKEYRFLLPALPFFLLSAAIGTGALLGAIRRRAEHRIPNAALIATALFLWTCGSISLAVRDRTQDIWARGAVTIAAFTDLHRTESLCGLGVIGQRWHLLPGYTYLHRDVPMYVFAKTDGWKRYRGAFNVALSRPAAGLEQDGYQRGKCYGEGQFCLYRRPGACAAIPARTINRMLIDLDD